MRKEALRGSLTLLFVAFLLASTDAIAGGRGGHGSHSGSYSSSSSSKSVYVHGYTRKDGTYVKGHYRAAPGSGESSTSVSSGSSTSFRTQPAYTVGKPGKREIAGTKTEDRTTGALRDHPAAEPKFKPRSFNVKPGETVSMRNGIAVKRDAEGHIVRSAEARDHFMKQHPCPSTGKTSGACPGYVVDHMAPLKRGGADDPSNMQWQTVEAAKAKDKIE